MIFLYLATTFTSQLWKAQMKLSMDLKMSGNP